MYGFQLVRGGTVVYNLTGASPGWSHWRNPVPDWARAIDGQPLSVGLELKPNGDPAAQDLLVACQLEWARFTRSRLKKDGPDCVIRLVE